MEDGTHIPLAPVVTTQPIPLTQPTSNDTLDSLENSSDLLQETQEEIEKEKKRRRDDCCYYNSNDCICDEGDLLDWFCFCRCIGHIFQSMGHCIGGCCDSFGECCQGCGECLCHGCCEAGGETVTDGADGADCDCGDGDCDCGDCDCDCF